MYKEKEFTGTILYTFGIKKVREPMTYSLNGRSITKFSKPFPTYRHAYADNSKTDQISCFINFLTQGNKLTIWWILYTHFIFFSTNAFFLNSTCCSLMNTNTIQCLKIVLVHVNLFSAICNSEIEVKAETHTRHWYWYKALIHSRQNPSTVVYNIKPCVF